MNKRKLGASDLYVHPISIGCWSFGGGADDYWGEQAQSDVENLVNEALDRGVNFFDTAQGYNDGRSESSLGKALGQRRKEAIICTKTPIRESAEEFEKGVVESLERLQSDYVDVLMIHWPTFDEALLETNLKALNDVCKKGYVRYPAVSNFGPKTMRIAKELGVPVVANEFAYSLISRGSEFEVVPYCLENDIGITAYMSLMQGILTGKYPSIADIPPRRRRTVQFDAESNPMVDAKHPVPHCEPQVQAVLDALKELAPQLGLSIGQLALAWCVNKSAITTSFVGCRDKQQLIDNAKAGEVQIPKEVMDALDMASQGVKDAMGNITDIFGRERIW